MGALFWNEYDKAKRKRQREGERNNLYSIRGRILQSALCAEEPRCYGSPEEELYRMEQKALLNLVINVC